MLLPKSRELISKYILLVQFQLLQTLIILAAAVYECWDYLLYALSLLVMVKKSGLKTNTDIGFQKNAGFESLGILNGLDSMFLYTLSLQKM